MRLVTELLARLRSFFGRAREDAELDEELRFHIDQETERIARSGVDRAEARRIAYTRFGGVERMRERTREARGTLWLERLLTDLRLAHRSLLRTPGQSLAAIVTLGLGIGVATTMFGTIYGAFYRALPWDDPEQFVWIEQTNDRSENGWAVPLHDFTEWREQSRSFRGLGASYLRSVNLRTSTETALLPAAYVTPNALGLLGIEPETGRGFTPEDGTPGAPLAVLLSRRVWEESYGSDPEMVGRQVAVNGEPATVVGIMPDGFHFPQTQDAWMPIRDDPALLARGEGPLLTVFGHLADGVTIEAAQSELSSLARRAAEAHPETNAGMGAEVLDLRSYTGAQDALVINWMLMLAALAVLLIACVNVANLLLARAARRVREVALRSALGAGRAQIIVHMLAESCALALYGAVVGAGVGWLGVAGIRQGMSVVDSTPYWVRFDFDVPVLLFAAAAAGGAGVVAGLIPAVRASRGELSAVLKDGSRGSTGLRIGRLSRGLVGVEVAFSVCLLAVSGLMVKSVVTLAGYDLPFEDERVLATAVGFFDQGEGTANAARFDTLASELLDRAAALPGVEAAALASRLPGISASSAPWEVEGARYADPNEIPLARTVTVSPTYFGLLDVEVVAGRPFTDLDGGDGPPTVIVNRSFADRHFPGTDPLGHRIRTGGRGGGAVGDWRTVVGVVPDLLMQGLEGAASFSADGVYLPASEAGLPSTLMLRARDEPLSVTPALRDLARSIHPDLAVYDVRTLPAALRQDTWYFVITSQVFVAFGAVALFLACIGILGVVAAESERRTREVGVRMALGARADDIVRLILGQGIGKVLLGTAVGLLMAMALSQAMAIVLFDTDPADPIVYVGAVVVIVVVSTLASLYPALRASKTDPVRALQAG